MPRGDRHLLDVERGIEHHETDKANDVAADESDEQVAPLLRSGELGNLGFRTIRDHRHAEVTEDLSGIDLHTRQGRNLISSGGTDRPLLTHARHPITF